MPRTNLYIHGTASAEQERLRKLNELTNAPFLSYLRLRPGSRVLELGSGLGIRAAMVAERVAPGLTVGVEYASEQLGRAPAPGSGLWFLQADAHSLPLKPASFDLVYCRFLLEHVRDPVAVLRAAHQALKPGGVIQMQENTILVNAFDPECPTFDTVWRKFLQLQQDLGGDAQIGKKLYRLLRQAGFSEIELSLAPEIHHAGQASYRPWIENLAGNIRSAERTLLQQGYCSPEEIHRTYDELEALADSDAGAAWFYWNRASARRLDHHEEGSAS